MFDQLPDEAIQHIAGFLVPILLNIGLMDIASDRRQRSSGPCCGKNPWRTAWTERSTGAVFTKFLRELGWRHNAILAHHHQLQAFELSSCSDTCQCHETWVRPLLVVAWSLRSFISRLQVYLRLLHQCQPCPCSVCSIKVLLGSETTMDGQMMDDVRWK